MEPWTPCTENLITTPDLPRGELAAVAAATTTTPELLSSPGGADNRLLLGFEDSFSSNAGGLQPASVTDLSSSSSPEEVKDIDRDAVPTTTLFQPLPDSLDYLDRLESKLKLVQARKGKSDKKGAGSNTNKERILSALLANSSDSLNCHGIYTDDDIDYNREVITNRVVRSLVPEQPLTVGETIGLIAADHLEQSHKPEDENPTEEPRSEAAMPREDH